jgi:hypothetical protein
MTYDAISSSYISFKCQHNIKISYATFTLSSLLYCKKSNVFATITREIIASKWFEVCGLISVFISIESAKSTRPQFFMQKDIRYEPCA